MCPIYDFQCVKCGKEFTSIKSLSEPNPNCPACDSETEKQVSAHGGYKMNSGPSSVRPRGAGSFKGKK